MLTKDLLRVSRAGGGYRPEFVGPDRRDLAARLVGVYQGHVGQSRERLQEAVTDLEREAEDFKLVRGLAKLLERESTFETRAPVEPVRARRAAFAAAESVGVVTGDERERAIERAADDLDATADAVAESLYADLPDRQVLVAFDPRWDPDELLAQYNLSLAQTALFDATEVRVRSSDPKRVVSAVKRLGLLYEIHLPEGGDSGSTGGVRADPSSGGRGHGAGDSGTTADSGVDAQLGDRTLVVTGPTALFRRTRRYGTRFARLLRTLAGTASWELVADVDDRGTERELRLTDADPVRVPGTDPVAEVTFDSGVERDFAARFEALGLDWVLVREPDLLATGTRAMVPDFAFDYAHRDFRVFFEIVGFWTPEYVEKKLAQLADVEDVELLVAVDRSLGVGEEIEARDHRVIPYSGTVRLKDVRDALRTYEEDLVAASAASLPEELAPDDDVVTLADLAARHGVSEAAIEDKAFPEHERVGRTLVRPGVLSDLEAEIEAGMDLSTVQEVLAERGIDDASATLSALGYRVEWAGLGGGTVRERE